ncbi:TorD/DmsD family molecular chaperone [Geoglobus sp.]
MDDVVEILKGRAGLYYLLSTLFKDPPDKEFIRDLRDGRVDVPDVDELREGFRIMRDFVSSFETVEDAENAVRQEFTDIFANPFSSIAVSPIQSTYEGDEPYREISARVMGKYREMGYRKIVKEEPPDHIAVELSFMAESCLNAIDAEDRVQELKNQKQFLEGEMWKWVFDFCDRLEEAGNFYRGVAKVLRNFIKIDGEIISELLYHSTRSI